MNHDEYRLFEGRWALPRKQTSPVARSIDDQVSELFLQCADKLTRSLRVDFGRDDTEEVTQEAFMRLYTSLSSGTPIDEPRAWVLAVARRLMIDRVRLDAKYALALDHGFDRQSTEPTPEDVWIDRRRIVACSLAWRELTDVERQCLVWRAEGLKLREIGARLGVLDHRRVADILGRATRHLRRRVHE